MNMQREDLKDVIYILMNGEMKLEGECVEIGKIIPNEFAEGAYCEQLYQKVYDANLRLCEKLGVEESKDVEIIISGLMRIGKHMAMKMYDYGELFAETEQVQ